MIEVNYQNKIYRLSEQQATLLMDYVGIRSIYRHDIRTEDLTDELISDKLETMHHLLYDYEVLIAGEQMPAEDDFIVEVMAAYGQLKQ